MRSPGARALTEQTKFRIGTSGYSYSDWQGCYYPPSLKSSEMLPFYAQEFDTVEINYTFYRMPTARALEAMANKVPSGFQFTLKVHQTITHARVPDPAMFREFCQALTPLQEQGKLGCVLAQFPTSFHNHPDNRNYLKRLREQIGDIPTVVEFRHRSWVQPMVFKGLTAIGLGFCCVDQPQFEVLMPAIAVATSAIAYVRLHGRNAAKWWEHEQAHERYDYSYSKSELSEWVPKFQTLSQQAHQVYIFANNCYKSQSIDTARLVKSLLGISFQPATIEAPRQLKLL